jgi:hypothetical protein
VINQGNRSTGLDYFSALGAEVSMSKMCRYLFVWMKSSTDVIVNACVREDSTPSTHCWNCCFATEPSWPTVRRFSAS